MSSKKVMYSAKNSSKIHAIFKELRKKALDIIHESSTAEVAVDRIASCVASELSMHSKALLHDMLYDLTNELMETDFFSSDVSRQNRFMERDLEREILDKYQFEPSRDVGYEEGSRMLHAAAVGGGAGATTLAVGVVADLGIVLISRLSSTDIAPIPIKWLVLVPLASAAGSALAYYFAAPKRSKKALEKFINSYDGYLGNLENSIHNWLDEVERYFDRRAEEIIEEIKKSL